MPTGASFQFSSSPISHQQRVRPDLPISVAPPAKHQKASNESVSFQKDIEVIVKTFGKLKLYGCGVDNWLRNIETYASRRYNDCEWLRTILRHVIDELFVKWLYKLEREKRAEAGSDELTWCDLRKKLKSEYDRLELVFLKLIAAKKSDFLSGIKVYKDDKAAFELKIKNQATTTYFKEKFNLIPFVMPAIKDDATLISLAISTSGDDSILNSLTCYRNSSIKEFLGYCSVEDEID